MTAFTDDFQSLFTRRLGVTRAEAAAAFEQPDDIRVLMRAETTIALKAVAGRRYSHLVIVAERTKPPKIVAAFPVLPALVEAGADALGVLQALCDAYGEPVVVQDREPTKLAMDVVYSPIPKHISEIYRHPPSKTPRRAENLATQLRVRMDPARGEMYLGLLYAVDVEKLARAIRAGERA